MWKKWFPKYKIPKTIDELVKSGVLVDKTRSVDVTPHFEAILPGGEAVLWVDHPDPAYRFLPFGPRYMVDLHPQGELKETLIETDSLEEALQVIEDLFSEGKGLRLL
jgi:hypothetical protein